MARICEKCGKGPTSGATRSHSNIQTKRVVLPNLQMKKVDGQRLKLCTTCIKSLTKKTKS